MREIKYRGYSEFYKKWLYGSLVDNLFKDRKTGEKCSYIFDTSLNENYDCWEDFIQDEELEVITNSVGQYTGLKDKSGVEIYEGDIVIVTEEDEDSCMGSEFNYKGVVSYGNSLKLSRYVPQYPSSFCLISKSFYREQALLFNERWSYEVIGNIYENPELLLNYFPFSTI